MRLLFYRTSVFRSILFSLSLIPLARSGEAATSTCTVPAGIGLLVAQSCPDQFDGDTLRGVQILTEPNQDTGTLSCYYASTICIYAVSGNGQSMNLAIGTDCPASLTGSARPLPSGALVARTTRKRDTIFAGGKYDCDTSSSVDGSSLYAALFNKGSQAVSTGYDYACGYTNPDGSTVVSCYYDVDGAIIATTSSTGCPAQLCEAVYPYGTLRRSLHESVPVIKDNQVKTKDLRSRRRG